jgi:hypothetical protein
MKLRTLPVLLLLGLAACGSPTPVVTVPTLAVLPTVTETETDVPTLPPTVTLEPSATPLPTVTRTSAPTLSPVPTDTTSPTEMPTFTPSLTITNTITPLPTDSPTPTRELPLLGGLAAMAANVTVLPPEIRYGTATLTAMAQLRASLPASGLPGTGASPTPVPPGTYVLATLPPPPTTSCPYPPPGSLNTYFTSDPALASLLGCPVGAPPASTLAQAAWQPFERGLMIYLQGTPGSIYVLSNDGQFRRFDDTFISGSDPESGGETPPSGLVEPVRGFGKVWRNNPDIRALIGWANQSERGDNATVQMFEHGRAVYLAGNGQTYFLIDELAVLNGGTWRAVVGGF